MAKQESRMGKSLKGLRLGKGYTLKMMSEYTGLSMGYLSNVEQGKTRLTVDNLIQICDLLGVDPASLLVQKPDQKMIIPLDKAMTVHYPDINQEMKIFDFGYTKPKYQYITIRPGKANKVEYFRHTYDEVGTVVEGTLSVEVEEQVYQLNKGDSIYISANRPHQIFNEFPETCVSFWVALFQ